MVQSLEFMNSWLIQFLSIYASMHMLLLIHAGIEVDSFR